MTPTEIEISHDLMGILPANFIYDMKNGETTCPKPCRFPIQ